MLVDSMTRPSHPDLLTPREEEVLALLREGLTNPQIAERLSITLDGAKYHVSEILSKLGVSSREEAARWEPSEHPWWATAAVPLAWSWRRANVSWLATGVAGITAVLVVVGVGLLVWGLVRTDSNDATSVSASATEPASPTAPLATLTPTTEPTVVPPTPSPSATTTVPTLPPVPTQPPPVPTADTRVPLGLPRADQFQLGEDGKYFVADRGDGCVWVEFRRVNDTDPRIGLEVFLRTDCPVDFVITFRPETGIVEPIIS